MRFLDLTVRNFRGFGPEAVPLNLDAELILFFGPNAYGKTSLSEAIEWLFYGTTKRRRRGDELNRTEYQGTFKNVHGGAPTEVVARVRLSDGSERTLIRRIEATAGQAERTITLIDGVAGDFAVLGLRAIEAIYPIIAQHELQTFIHTKPRDRRDAISAALGLDELATLKTVLDGARRSFNATPPVAVTQARTTIRALAPGLAKLGATAEVAQRWQRAPNPQIMRDTDIATLVTAAQALTRHETGEIETLLGALRTQRAEAVRQVFEIAKLAPPAIRMLSGSAPRRRAPAFRQRLRT
jgi:hypothetical protein